MTRQEILSIAKGIKFNTDMVRAIQDNRKTVTRRVITPHNKAIAKKLEYSQGNGLWIDGTHIKDYTVSSCWIDRANYLKKYAPYQVGDYLYVRETWAKWDNNLEKDYVYKASDNDFLDVCKSVNLKWHPSIHMPKETARIFLRVTAVRVERLQNITVDGVKQEGIQLTYPLIDMIKSEHLKKFIAIWDSTIKKADIDRYGWNANCWVWVIEFERVMAE